MRATSKTAVAIGSCPTTASEAPTCGWLAIASDVVTVASPGATTSGDTRERGGDRRADEERRLALAARDRRHARIGDDDLDGMDAVGEAGGVERAEVDRHERSLNGERGPDRDRREHLDVTRIEDAVGDQRRLLAIDRVEQACRYSNQVTGVDERRVGRDRDHRHEVLAREQRPVGRGDDSREALGRHVDAEGAGHQLVRRVLGQRERDAGGEGVRREYHARLAEHRGHARRHQAGGEIVGGGVGAHVVQQHIEHRGLTGLREPARGLEEHLDRVRRQPLGLVGERIECAAPSVLIAASTCAPLPAPASASQASSSSGTKPASGRRLASRLSRLEQFARRLAAQSPGRSDRPPAR